MEKEEPRVCAGAGCRTILSRFNPDDLCARCWGSWSPPSREIREKLADLEAMRRREKASKKTRSRIDPEVGDGRSNRPDRPPMVPLTDETAPPVLGELCNTIHDALKKMMDEEGKKA